MRRRSCFCPQGFPTVEVGWRNTPPNRENVLRNRVKSIIMSAEVIIFASIYTKQNEIGRAAERKQAIVIIRQEDRDYVEEIYRRRFASLYSYALSALSTPTLAEEAVQETFQIASSKIEVLRKSENPEGWITLTHKNVVRNTVRRQAVLRSMIACSLEEEQPKMPGQPDEESVDLLYSNLREDSDYALIKRLAIDQRSILEISAELGISVDACKKRIQRAKKRLHKKLKEI